MTEATHNVTPPTFRTWHDNHYRRTSPETRPRVSGRFDDIPDPYNPGNRMSGWVQRATGDDYGTLVVASINGKPAPQRIMGTPKASYPYAKDRGWLLQQADSIRAFLKYDGTNLSLESPETLFQLDTEHENGHRTITYFRNGLHLCKEYTTPPFDEREFKRRAVPHVPE